MPRSGSSRPLPGRVGAALPLSLVDIPRSDKNRSSLPRMRPVCGPREVEVLADRGHMVQMERPAR